MRSYAFDLRDLFEFLDTAGIEWTSVRLEDFGRFVAWLRLPAGARSGQARARRSPGPLQFTSSVGK